MLRRMLIAFALVGLVAAAGGASAEPAFQVTPTDVVEGQPVDVVIVGVPAGGTVTVRASRAWPLYPRGDERYEARATFRADARGRVDLKTSPPLKGSSYDRPAAAGLFWSMEPTRRMAGLPQPPPSIDDIRTGRMVMTAEASNGMARAEVLVRPHANNVVVREIREPRVTGVYARDAAVGKQPAVIVIGGSEGGLFTGRQIAPLIASHGYAVLGVGYFQGGEPSLTNLPPNLERIPIETLDAARAWLAAQPGVDARRIGVVGVSKGAEMALLAAATYPWVAAVGAFAPSHVIWEGIPPDGEDRAADSSWTVAGRPTPYVRWSRTAARRGDEVRAATGVSRLTEVHLESLVEFAADVEAARLPIEKSPAAFLLVAGQDDGMWPSALATEDLRKRLQAHGRPDPEMVFSPTGHQILGTGWGPTTAFHRPKGLRQGGDPRLDAEAQAIAWPALLRLLETHLRGGENGRSPAITQ